MSRLSVRLQNLLQVDFSILFAITAILFLTAAGIYGIGVAFRVSVVGLSPVSLSRCLS